MENFQNGVKKLYEEFHKDLPKDLMLTITQTDGEGFVQVLNETDREKVLSDCEYLRTRSNRTNTVVGGEVVDSATMSKPTIPEPPVCDVVGKKNIPDETKTDTLRPKEKNTQDISKPTSSTTRKRSIDKRPLESSEEDSENELNKENSEKEMSHIAKRPKLSKKSLQIPLNLEPSSFIQELLKSTDMGTDIGLPVVNLENINLDLENLRASYSKLEEMEIELTKMKTCTKALKSYALAKKGQILSSFPTEIRSTTTNMIENVELKVIHQIICPQTSYEHFLKTRRHSINWFKLLQIIGMDFAMHPFKMKDIQKVANEKTLVEFESYMDEHNLTGPNNKRYFGDETETKKLKEKSLELYMQQVNENLTSPPSLLLIMNKE